jgi:hypothetical protein
MTAARCIHVASLTEETPFANPAEAWAYLLWAAQSVLNDDQSSQQDFDDALKTVDDIAQHCPYPTISRRAKAIIAAVFWRLNPPPPLSPRFPPTGPEAA